MTQQWLLAKYVRDLRRREPRNVGIILFTGTQVHARFLAEIDPDNVDGRSTKWAGSTNNYRAWVHYWRTASPSKSPAELVSHTSADNYYLEHGGQVLAGPERDPEQFLNELYQELVDSVPAPRSARPYSRTVD